MVTVLILTVAAIAGVAGYAWGRLTGSASARHPENCWARIRAAEQRAEKWANCAADLKGKVAELEHDLTWTGEFLVAELDKVAGGYAPAPVTYASLPLALTAGR